jgi:hypothetical protein
VIVRIITYEKEHPMNSEKYIGYLALDSCARETDEHRQNAIPRAAAMAWNFDIRAAGVIIS